jgi:IS5 family transposase
VAGDDGGGGDGISEDQRARRPLPLERKLSTYLLQLWFNLSDPAVEQEPIGVIKRVFGFQKVRYRGLAKNLHRLEVTAALANLYTVRRWLLRA